MAKFNSKPLVLATAIAAAAAAFAATAQTGAAQDPNTPPVLPDTTMMQRHHDRAATMSPEQDARRMQRRVERMQVRIAQHLAALKVRLQITPAQQGAWNTFEQAMQPTPEQLQRMMSMRAEMKNLTTPQRIDRLRSLRAERDAAMDQRFDAAKTFYAQLSPEQQKTFDAEAMRWTGGGGGKGAHGRRHGGGWHHGGDGDRFGGEQRYGG